MSEKYKIRNQEKLYFVTFSVVAWVDVFTRIEYKNIVIDSLKFCQLHKGLEIYAWCLMTNHIHLIIGKGEGESNPKMEEVIRDFKKFTSVQICRAIKNNDAESRKDWMLKIFSDAASQSSKHEKYMFWQNEYHPVELFNNAIMSQKLDYIHQNPVLEGIVQNVADYYYSSARCYAGMDGLIDIRFIE